MASKNPVIKLQQSGTRKIVKTVGHIVRLATKFLGDPNKTGGYFCLLEMRTGAILVITIIGSVDPSKAVLYRRYAEEKALRLYRNWQHTSTPHISSWQSRNEAENAWGGAVMGNRFIYSFSGFPELHDEGITLTTAFKLDDMPAKRAEDIMFHSCRRMSDAMTHPARALIKALG